MVYKNKSDDYKNNYCVDVVMIWLQTVANIIHIQVLFWRDCAGFGVSPLIWDRAPRPDARQPLDRRPGQPPGLFPDFCPMSLFPQPVRGLHRQGDQGTQQQAVRRE